MAALSVPFDSSVFDISSASSSSSSSSSSSFPCFDSSSASISASLSSFRSRNARIRNIPRRGRIKAAIFASIFEYIASILGAGVRSAKSVNGSNSGDDGELWGRKSVSVVGEADSRSSFDEDLPKEIFVTGSPVSDMSASSEASIHRCSLNLRDSGFDGHMLV